MPYIDPAIRKDIDSTPVVVADNCGELNYTLSRICRDYLAKKGLRYQTINDIVGALEGCKLEFTRQVTNDYEDTKIKHNGPVYKEIKI